MAYIKEWGKHTCWMKTIIVDYEAGCLMLSLVQDENWITSSDVFKCDGVPAEYFLTVGCLQRHASTF